MSVSEVEGRDCFLSGTKRKVMPHTLYANTDTVLYEWFPETIVPANNLMRLSKQSLLNTVFWWLLICVCPMENALDNIFSWKLN